MELILWRHADAEYTLPDMDRALSNKGRKQAAAMASWLLPRLPEHTHILVSPARRTRQTARALDLDFSTLELLAPGASAESVLQATGWPDAEGSVLIVGHQPTLGMVAALAMTGQPDAWCVKKGAVWWLSSRLRDEQPQCVLRSVLCPDQL